MNEELNQIKIAFYFDRASVAKTYAPVVVECLKRNIKVIFICGPNPDTSWPHNPGYRPLKENIKIPLINKVDFIYFDEFDQAGQRLIDLGVSNLFIVHAIDKDQEAFFKKLKENGLMINCIQWTGDYLVIDPGKMALIDRLFVYSPKMIDLYFARFPNASQKELLPKFIPVGNPIFDSLKSAQTREAILKKYKIACGNKKIVLLMSLNLVTPWSKYYFGASNKFSLFLNFIKNPNFKYLKDTFKYGGYKRSLRLLKEWCRENDALLVVKSRPKHREPKYVKDLADIIITDDSWYPITSVELTSIADMVIGYNSTVAMEAGFLGVYGISIDIERELDDPRVHPLIEYMESGIHGYKGISSWVNYKRLASFLKAHKLKDFNVDKNRQQSYIKKYHGYDDFSSSARIVDYLLKRVIGQDS